MEAQAENVGVHWYTYMFRDWLMTFQDLAIGQLVKS